MRENRNNFVRGAEIMPPRTSIEKMLVRNSRNASNIVADFVLTY